MSDALKHLRKDEIRAAIAVEVGLETDRYENSRRGFRKRHLLTVANEIGDPPEDITLAELYRWLCDQCGIDYNDTAGNQWRLGRDQLKAIYHQLLSSANQISLGDVVDDRDGTSPRGVVVNRPPIPAKDWHVPGKGPVSLHNPDYPSDDRISIVLFEDVLEATYPNFTGGRAIPMDQLNNDTIDYYAFPESRLRPVDQRESISVALEDVEPSPYHARNFDVAANREYIDAIEERGRPKQKPLVRDLGDAGFELLNGHKRLWASHVAGLESITVECIYLGDYRAAQYWASYHLDQYDSDAQETALSRLREHFSEYRVDQIKQEHLSDEPDTPSRQAKTDGGRDE